MGLIVADWDTVSDYRAWRGGIGTNVNTLIERTGRGYHMFFFGDGLPSAVGDGCEFKTSGVCMVTPSVHPSDVIYHIVNDAPIAQIDETKARQLFPFLSEAGRKRERVDLKDDLARNAFESRKIEKPVLKGVVARIKDARSIVDEMQAAGVELRPGGTDTFVGLCPFHDDHSPSLWVYPHSGLWGCNKPSCSAAGIHDVINLRALLRGISNSMAIRELADEFL